MFQPADVSGVLITLHIESEQVLFILLTADGAANRMGTGAEDNAEKQLYIAQTSGEMFEQLKSRIDPSVAQWSGGYSDPEPVGKPCRLQVGFMVHDGEQSMCEFNYGTESQGPPPELCRLVVDAIDVTEAWYQQFQSASQG